MCVLSALDCYILPPTVLMFSRRFLEPEWIIFASLRNNLHFLPSTLQVVTRMQACDRSTMTWQAGPLTATLLSSSNY
jgi:hypothetical protein